MNQKSQMKAESRERILAAAADLFRTKGFNATGIDELMSKAELTAGAFYAHFKSKTDLFDEAIRYMIKASAKRLTAGLESRKGKDLITEFLKRYVNEVHRDRPEMGCAIPSIASEISRHSKKGRETIDEYVNKWVEYFAKELKGNPDERREHALRLVCQAVGALLLSRMVGVELSKEVIRSGQKIE